ncbi:MAG: PGPGW domain-containing protein [Melioribacteraceae bacterium]|nr:PGPGW domain-containing protein [Melioribacteraceae bacterium]MCF8355362.1 PGPGW domain-containing protein [Melioribacteraceae bacterium]MCF8395174.1 PGPGW domain-containing protein [Melioribacteraceae bacterium]MCF8420257.1 PGPGW domain-containing protein [Melioribacteraceae bacterium]
MENLGLIVLPGPAFIVIPLGLSILATEFVWVKKLLSKVKDTADSFKSKR